MADLRYTFARVLYGQPLSVTVAAIASKLARRRASKVGAPLASSPPVHPVDAFYGIETSGLISPRRIRSDSPSDAFSIGYGGAQPSVLRAVLATIPDLESACFLDVGCGKGRALAVATEFPFRRIVGVELSPDLARIAEKNAVVMGSSFPDRTPIEVIEGDALKFELPAGYVVAFFHHPGFEPLVRGFAARLAAHQTEAGNRVLLVYYNPAFGRIFDDDPAFARYYAGRHLLRPGEDSSNFGESEYTVVIWKSNFDPAPPHPGANAKIRATALNAVLET